MAQFELRLKDFIESRNYIICESCWLDGLISLTISNNGIKSHISLDKSTAIKLSKTLRTEINKITASEGGQNG